MTDWHDFDTDKPRKSGYYMVEDRKGRVFRAWYETTVQGFDMVHDGVGYKIMRWRKENEQGEILHDGREGDHPAGGYDARAGVPEG